MIDYLDSFVDTRTKRRLLVKTLCWLGWLFWCGCALYTAVRLWMLSDYASLFSLLNDPSMQLFPISRMVLSMMSIAQVTGRPSPSTVANTTECSSSTMYLR